MVKTGYENMDVNIYSNAAAKYLPAKIKYLFIAESPPAFYNLLPEKYFYFEKINGDGLFYTLIKAIYDKDIVKGIDAKTKYLSKLKKDGIFLIDTVEYPINKTIIDNKINNNQREEIIKNNKPVFENRIKSFISEGHIDSDTKCILIKETVYNQYKNYNLLYVMNSSVIIFPRYIKDRDVISGIQQLIE